MRAALGGCHDEETLSTAATHADRPRTRFMDTTQGGSKIDG